ncbi:MAG: acetylornithine deacetylase or succinyl-diaminopimelate desuccinylase [Thermomicrobiales bacterium]|nr:acetylornithine deacetylase or succinyl-diaminopimelate desuccinylase [Thermomicrobiales bacterium]
MHEPFPAGICDDHARAVLAAIDPEETIAFLRDLVRAPSVNPPGDVAEAAAVCERPLVAAGFSVRSLAHEPGKPNIVAEWGVEDGPALCFNAHLDVVPTGDESVWLHPPFAGEIADGRVFGRGAGDDKASVTAQVMGAIALARSGVPLRGRLLVTEVADEETSGAGALHLIAAAGIQPDGVIVGEQTLNRVAIGEKGTAGVDIVVTGRTAHGALPWEGANAIEGMARVIVALGQELQPRLAERTHPYFKPSSASVNMVDGGVKANVVPDRCAIFVDRRLIPGEDPVETTAEIQAIADEAIAGVPGIDVQVIPVPDRFAATMSDPQGSLAQSMLAANAYLELSTELTGFSMASDGRHFAAAGYPTLIYGPGDPRLAHVPDEWVGIDEVLEATRAYALAALAFLGPGAG